MKNLKMIEILKHSIMTGETVTVSMMLNGKEEHKSNPPTIDVNPGDLSSQVLIDIPGRDHRVISKIENRLSLPSIELCAFSNRHGDSKPFHNIKNTVTCGRGQKLDHSSALIRDLFCREMQFRDELLPVLKILRPNGYCDGDLFIDGIFVFSLSLDSCGCWAKNCNAKNIKQYAEYENTIGIESYIEKYHGVTKEKSFEYIYKIRNLKKSQEERFAFDRKPGWSQIMSFDTQRLKNHKFEMDLLRAYGFEIKSIYPYLNYDNSIHHFVCDFESPDGVIVKLPHTLWENQNGHSVFDWLYPQGIVPLYNLNQFYRQNRAILVCENEGQVEYIRTKHPRVADGVCLTTWSGGMSITIEGSDWSALDGRQVVILVGPSRDGYKKAHKIYKTLSQLGFKRIEFLMCWDSLALNESSSSESNLDKEKIRAFDNDLLKATLISGDVCESSVFFEDARCRYGLKFMEYHSRSVDLNELLSMELPESIAVLAPIIMAGDKVMIFAHRGSGKTWLICFIVCAIGSGNSILDGTYFAPNPLRVLVFDGEMRLKKLQERYDFVCESMDIPEHLRSNIRLRASSIEGKQIKLETPEERAPFNDDIEWADVIVIDSVFCLFPNAMSGSIEGADGLNDFLISCSLQGKTVIAVDHTGKSKKSSFGTSAKEFGLDVVIKLEKPKESKDEFKMTFTKGRNLGAKDKQDVKFSLSVDEDAGVANLDLLSEDDDDEDDVGSEERFNEGDDFSGRVLDGTCPLNSFLGDSRIALSGLDETDSKIIAANKDIPGISVRKLAKLLGISKSTVGNRRKKLEQAGLVQTKGCSIKQMDDDEDD